MQISKEDLFLPQNYLGEKAKQDQKTSKSLCARHCGRLLFWWYSDGKTAFGIAFFLARMAQATTKALKKVPGESRGKGPWNLVTQGPNAS